MPQGDKSKYTSKQKRQAEHIEEGYEERGVRPKEAKSRAWATVNKITHGGKKVGGSGHGKKEDHSPERKGGKIGGKSKAAKKSATKSPSTKAKSKSTTTKSNSIKAKSKTATTKRSTAAKKVSKPKRSLKIKSTKSRPTTKTKSK